jgi:hypothetical protein
MDRRNGSENGYSRCPVCRPNGLRRRGILVSLDSPAAALRRGQAVQFRATSMLAEDAEPVTAS